MHAVAMAEQDSDLLGDVGGILEGISGKLPEADFDLDCSDEVRLFLFLRSRMYILCVDCVIPKPHYCSTVLLPTC